MKFEKLVIDNTENYALFKDFWCLVAVNEKGEEGLFAKGSMKNGVIILQSGVGGTPRDRQEMYDLGQEIADRSGKVARIIKFSGRIIEKEFYPSNDSDQ